MPDMACRTTPLRPGTTTGAHQRKLVFGFDPLSDRIDV